MRLAFILSEIGSGLRRHLSMVISVILVLDRYATRRSMLAALATLLSYHVATIEVLGSRGGLRRLKNDRVPACEP